LHTTLWQVTFAGGIEEYPAWSPDGKLLLYTGEVGKVRKIFRKDLASGQEWQLAHGDFDELQPTWSPAGTQVAFVRAARRKVATRRRFRSVPRGGHMDARPGLRQRKQTGGERV
jgi:Tol biopolymer transport system component